MAELSIQDVLSVDTLQGRFYRVECEDGRVFCLTKDQVDPCGHGLHEHEPFVPFVARGVKTTHTEVEGWAGLPRGDSFWTDVHATEREAAIAAYRRREAEIAARDTPEHRAAFDAVFG